DAFVKLAHPLRGTAYSGVTAVVGAALEVTASRVMEQRIGLPAEAYTTGRAHRLRQLSEALTVGGAVGAVLGRRRAVTAMSGAALLVGSALQRFAVFEAGVESTRDPKYVVVPQRERVDARERTGV
ncbi:polysulfide reductase, partial [Mycolicibacterium elephantis]